MAKPCRLVLLQRTLKNPDLFGENHPVQYWAGPDALEKWVEFRSNAVLLDKSAAKRDLLDNPSFTESNQFHLDRLDPKYCETEFSLVELIEKKSFGWIIRRPYTAASGTKYQYLAGITGEQETESFRWLNSPLNATLLYPEHKDAIMGVLKQTWPDAVFDAKELFWE